MADKQKIIDEKTYPHLETGPRVFHTICGDDERDAGLIQHRTVKAIGLVVARLEKAGLLTQADIDDLLLETVL